MENHAPSLWFNPYRNLKSENSHDYAQKPQGNCIFMNSASGHNLDNHKYFNDRISLLAIHTEPHHKYYMLT
jgi:hypothetical protein